MGSNKCQIRTEDGQVWNWELCNSVSPKAANDNFKDCITYEHIIITVLESIIGDSWN